MSAPESDPALVELLELELNVYERKVEARTIREIASAVRGRPVVSIGIGGGDGRKDPREAAAPQLHAHLRALVVATHERVLELRRRGSEFSVAYARTISEDDRQQLILDFAGDLGASRRQLRGDARAFARWFDEDAVRDRFTRRLNLAERRLAFYLGRFSAVSAFLLERAEGAEETRWLWERLAVEETVKPLLVHDGDPRVVLAAFRALARALREVPAMLQERSVQEGTLQFIYRSAMQAQQDVWIQSEALSLLESLSPDSLRRVLERRLGQPGEGDDLFLRRRAVEILGRNARRVPELFELLSVVRGDPSPFVRQGMAAIIPKLPAGRAADTFRRLALHDVEPPVRAAALCEGLSMLERSEPGAREAALDVLLQVLERETDSFVLRVATHAASDGARYLAATGSAFTRRWKEEVFDALGRLHTTADDLAVRRWAAQGRERIWCVADPRVSELRERLEPLVRRLEPGRRHGVDARHLRGIDDETLGRVLSVIAQEDFGFDVRRARLHARITRGHRFSFRLWRAFHELRHPSPDKRQAHPHTIGRVFRGDLRVPSSVLSELAETEVPGEPLFLGAEKGWRPYLPLVDDVLSSLDQRLRPETVRFYTSEGVTELTPPRSPAARVKAYLDLTRRFPHWARMRNWQSEQDGAPKEYIERLEALGFRIRFRPHADGAGGSFTADSAVTRFFPAASVALPLGLAGWGRELWDPLWNYFVSVYENTLYELAIFAGITLSIFAGRHLVSNYTLREARDGIPLVIGGWGTRGKSGTERIKAALFSALGYGFVSKTTGCEAMFLYAHPFGATREMFLFRPYDKATIWEQRNVVRIARRFDMEVFLWECMGLTPSYVKILQRQWMRDDLSTITNTYPDHEDLQGPAGVDIPHVMCNFIPENGSLFTTEEQMLPILAHACQDLDTSCRAAGWLEAGLLPRDVLARFPYEEHPHNIALVLAVAGELGIERDYALKAMADHVVADIGVLKTYPPAPVRSRRLEFTNGMSANERHGCLGNWTRLGFDEEDAVERPGVWVVTVVNNRADRIARSRVFADILVKDISADRHVLIGNNLKGLEGYLREAWDAHSQGLSLFRDHEDGSAGSPLEALQGWFRWHRLPTSEDAIELRVRAMLEGQSLSLPVDRLAPLWREPAALRGELTEAGLAAVVDDVVEHVEELREALGDYQALAERLGAGSGGQAGADAAFRETLWKWYRRKIVVVEDYFATGDEVIDRLGSATPPGLHARIMGLQNIKGTGLDFVYRWQAWETCWRACQLLRGQDMREAERGLDQLASFREYGLLSAEHVRETIDIVRRSPAAQRERFQAELGTIESNLSAALRAVDERLQQGGASSAGGRFAAWIERACGLLEELFDAGDGVKRRKLANLIYRDLIDERISSERAALELQALNKRQKGGWLYKSLQSAREMVARNLRRKR